MRWLKRLYALWMFSGCLIIVMFIIMVLIAAWPVTLLLLVLFLTASVIWELCSGFPIAHEILELTKEENLDNDIKEENIQ